MKKQKKKVTIVEASDAVAPVAQEAPLVPVTSGLSRAELQARMKAKMEAFKHKRGADVEANKKKQAEKHGRREQQLVMKKAKKVAVAAKKASGPPAKSVVVEGRQIFSKFDFSTSADDGKKKSLTPSNPKQALQKALARAGRIEQVASVDKTRAEQMQRSDAWAKAIQKAQGIVIKDDPRLLKKSINRLEKAKTKRSERWKEREQSTKDDQMARQKKRQANIDARKKGGSKSAGGNKSAGGSKSFGKGGSGGVKKKRPGFEGSHFKKVQKKK